MPPVPAFAITGMGAVTPLGNASRTWQALLAGASATTSAPEPLRAAGCEVVAPVGGFEPTRYMERYAAAHMGRFSQFAVAACRMALDDAGVDPSGLSGAGLVVHTGAGGLVEAEAAAMAAAARPRRVNPYFTAMFGPNMAACQSSIELGIQGPVLGGVGACAAGIQAVIDALRLLQHGEAEVVVAAGTDAALSPVLLGSLANAGALAGTAPGRDPARACRPFDAGRTGMVAAEGSAAFVLEPVDRALARGARPRAVVAGGGRAGDAHHVTAPHPEGRGTVAALQRALADARLEPAAVGAVVAHATGTPRGDEAEVRALHRVFGSHLPRVAVTAPKGALGHGLGAAGAFGVLIGALALAEGALPPTRNLDDVDPACAGPAHVAGSAARPAGFDVVVVNAAGFGGQNAAVVLTRVSPGPPHG